jgi:RNA polymerase sigma-70 factor (ECF subfamily)
MQRPAPSDGLLIQAVRQRDERALKALYERYGALVFSLALRKLNDRGLAEEVLQDVFFRCWEQAHTYRPEAGSLAAWLFGITRNRCIDVRRGRQAHARERERDELPSPDTLQEPGRADAAEVVALQLTVQAALNELTPPQRQAITLAYYDDLSQSEIARRLGEPLGTVKTRIRAAMERLRRTLAIAERGEMDERVAEGRD